MRASSRAPGPVGRVVMRDTCNYVVHMSRMIQIRNVPDELHRELKARAAQAGMTLSDYLLHEIRILAQRPTRGELLERIRRRGGVQLDEGAADIVRAERDAGR